MDGMSIVIGLLFWISGLLIGSFVNMLVYRLPLELGFVKGRSMCPKCKHPLSALDLVPVLSFLALKGKCRYCQEKISWRYPLVELLTGFLFLLAFMQFGLWDSLPVIVFWVMLIIVTLIDLDHFVIMDGVLIVGVIFQTVSMILLKRDILDHFIGMAIGAGFYLLIYWVARLFYKKEAFGMGDVFLMGSVCYFLGKELVFLACFFPFYIAAIFLVVMKVFDKNEMHRHTEIAFGPYICISGWLLSLYGDEIQHFLLGMLNFY